MADVVVDASALVDVLLRNDLGHAVRTRLRGNAVHAPAHLDAEVLSALGRLSRAGQVEPDDVTAMIGDLQRAPLQRHLVGPLVPGAWARRHQLRLVDALYVELADRRGAKLVTTDRRLRHLHVVDVVEP